MLNILFTIYCILCVIFGGVLIVYFCVYNTLPKKLYKWMAIFLPATLVVGFTGMAWFTVGYYLSKKGD